MSVFTVRRPVAAFTSAFTLMALGLAAGVSGAGAMRDVLVEAGAGAATGGADAMTPLGRMASSLVGVIAGVAAGAGVTAPPGAAGVWAWTAAGNIAQVNSKRNSFFIALK